MITRRDAAIGMLVGISGLAAIAGPATAQQKVSEAEALAALNPWADALLTGDPATVEKVLAPEYQIVRSNGTGLDKASYLKSLPRQRTRSKFSDIVATRHGDVMVLRYRIATQQTIEGKSAEPVSARLSVFRKDGTRWLIVAHANFGRIG